MHPPTPFLPLILSPADLPVECSFVPPLPFPSRTLHLFFFLPVECLPSQPRTPFSHDTFFNLSRESLVQCPSPDLQRLSRGLLTCQVFHVHQSSRDGKASRGGISPPASLLPATLVPITVSLLTLSPSHRPHLNWRHSPSLHVVLFFFLLLPLPFPASLLSLT